MENPDFDPTLSPLSRYLHGFVQNLSKPPSLPQKSGHKGRLDFWGTQNLLELESGFFNKKPWHTLNVFPSPLASFKCLDVPYMRHLSNSIEFNFLKKLPITENRFRCTLPHGLVKFYMWQIKYTSMYTPAHINYIPNNIPYRWSTWSVVQNNITSVKTIITHIIFVYQNLILLIGLRIRNFSVSVAPFFAAAAVAREREYPDYWIEKVKTFGVKQVWRKINKIEKNCCSLLRKNSFRLNN